MHKFLFLGPQGSGKGTQANLLAQKLNIPALSMGQLLREEKKSGSELGQIIASHIDAGELVPDEVTTAVLKKRPENDDVKNGFIIDSFPRFIEQYHSSKDFFRPTAVVVLSIPPDESLKRLMKRAEIEQRVDDTPELLEKRLKWSIEKTQPVIDKYKEEGLVLEIDGMGTMEEVEGRIDAALDV